MWLTNHVPIAVCLLFIGAEVNSLSELVTLFCNWKLALSAVLLCSPNLFYFSNRLRGAARNSLVISDQTSHSFFYWFGSKLFSTPSIACLIYDLPELRIFFFSLLNIELYMWHLSGLILLITLGQTSLVNHYMTNK